MIKNHIFQSLKSQKQIKMRAERITGQTDNCFILTETKTQNIFRQIEEIEPQETELIHIY